LEHPGYSDEGKVIMLAENNCPDCAHELAVGSKFCTRCGINVSSTQGKKEAAAAAAQIMEDLCKEGPPILSWMKRDTPAPIMGRHLPPPSPVPTRLTKKRSRLRLFDPTAAPPPMPNVAEEENVLTPDEWLVDNSTADRLLADDWICDDDRPRRLVEDDRIFEHPVFAADPDQPALDESITNQWVLEQFEKREYIEDDSEQRSDGLTFPEVLFKYGDLPLTSALPPNSPPEAATSGTGDSDASAFPHESIYSVGAGNQLQIFDFSPTGSNRDPEDANTESQKRLTGTDVFNQFAESPRRGASVPSTSELPYFLRGYASADESSYPIDQTTEYRNRAPYRSAGVQFQPHTPSRPSADDIKPGRFNLKALGALDSSLALLVVAYCGAVVWWVAHLVGDQNSTAVSETPQTVVGTSIVSSGADKQQPPTQTTQQVQTSQQNQTPQQTQAAAQNQTTPKAVAAAPPDEHKRPIDRPVVHVWRPNFLTGLPPRPSIDGASDGNDGLNLPEQSAPPEESQSKYSASDMAQYNKALADYFAHQGGNGHGDKEPPTLDDWLSQGKPKF
jgi:hypothetical protein